MSTWLQVAEQVWFPDQSAVWLVHSKFRKEHRLVDPPKQKPTQDLSVHLSKMTPAVWSFESKIQTGQAKGCQKPGLAVALEPVNA